MTGVPLAEELLLLAYDDETGKATLPRISLDLGMAAAVLIELALAGRLAYADGSLTVVDPTPTGEPVTDAVLAKIAADTPHSPASWVQRLRHGLRDRILGDLCAQGVVRDVDETELGFIHVHRYPVVDPSVEAETRQRLAEALTGAAPDERTAALATLVAVLRMESALGVSGEAAADARRRLAAIATGAGFSGEVSLEDSVVRPSVGLVVAALGRAVEAALGPRR
ncbi:Golgi phosphoprotein 3 (GPP34) [Micromonospora phaseoli]|uniref:Golgi phosphoprotein 3 (GPP34) n=1 Tax=Micromonospora phaseoli TaxID=1144548 RepID=A0A1H6ZRT0_9ACTN|nr:GPP34 family phosphoprotein [Micromonospora phaseoli]PZV97103.1 Golgi phosphoprotein 3 GPP34 [Micromonospora phaseoli]SEJ54864.1 Golgi phosphoprotein 3 (GPP34) [Micromonospora phaseoli]